ncbi:MAG: 3-hydroxyacyl-CoA dehydrogenase NAD-binding domain-containing protein [Betaproteobacteria bacterium]
MSFKLKKVLIFGGGTMGTDLSVRFAKSGISAVVFARAGKTHDTFWSRASVSASDLEVDINDLDIQLCDELDQIPWDELELVVENVSESLAIKREVFSVLAKRVHKHTIVTSNSSTFSISKIAQDFPLANRCFGLHFFMPAHLVPLVELVLGAQSEKATALELRVELEKLGLTTVLVEKDVPGFLANRIQASMMREVWNVIESGIASPEDVDKAVRYGFGFRLMAAGPVMQKEISGLDVTFEAGKSVFPDLSNANEPPSVLAKKIENGNFGMKTGRGFWSWTQSEAQHRRAEYIRVLKESLKILKSVD